MGYLGADAETRAVGGGDTSVTNLRLATTHRKKTAGGDWIDETDWHSISAWRVHPNLQTLLRRGAKVLVKGRLKTRSWEDQNGQKRYKTEVVCSGGDIMLCGGSAAKPSGGAPADGPSQAQAAPAQKRPDFNDEDIPF